MLLILTSVFLFNEHLFWPGLAALVPVSGAALIIASKRDKSAFTTSIVSQFLGKTSYSIYLWHWPVVVALYYLGLIAVPAAAMCGILLSIILGWISFVSIENSTRRLNAHANLLSTPIGILLLSVAACAVSAWVFVEKGYPGRAPLAFDELAKTLIMARSDNGWCFYSVDTDSGLQVGKGQDCNIGYKGSTTKGLLFGDSYAGQYDPFWDKIGKDVGVSITSITTNWCFPSLEKTYSHPTHMMAQEQCLSNRRFVESHIDRYDFIILAGQWSDILSDGDFPEVERLVDEASSKTKVLILMAAPFKFDTNPRVVFESALFVGARASLNSIGTKLDFPLHEANARVRGLAGRYRNAVYVTRDQMFSINGALSPVDRLGIPYTFDGSHISIHGALSAADNFMATPQYQILKRTLLRSD
ncbi:MAG: acyltransferase family protein [Formivibrio sp.]|nr:acyltransferase family protein [Formivibrio sp.]